MNAETSIPARTPSGSLVEPALPTSPHSTPPPATHAETSTAAAAPESAPPAIPADPSRAQDLPRPSSDWLHRAADAENRYGPVAVAGSASDVGLTDRDERRQGNVSILSPAPLTDRVASAPRIRCRPREPQCHERGFYLRRAMDGTYELHLNRPRRGDARGCVVSIHDQIFERHCPNLTMEPDDLPIHVNLTEFPR